jgi:hypothetical protein
LFFFDFFGAVRQMRSSLRYPNPTFASGGENAAPLDESSDTVDLEERQAGEAAFLAEVI